MADIFESDRKRTRAAEAKHIKPLGSQRATQKAKEDKANRTGKMSDRRAASKRSASTPHPGESMEAYRTRMHNEARKLSERNKGLAKQGYSMKKRGWGISRKEILEKKKKAEGKK